MGTAGSARLVASAILAALLGCSTTHPLDSGGTVSMTISAPGPLFAPPPPPITVRQRDSAVVSMTMVEGGDLASGAFVEVTASPGGVLAFTSTDGSCAENEGTFRCTAASNGKASFQVNSNLGLPNGVSATVQVAANWPGGSSQLAVLVDPAGIPTGGALALAVEGTGDQHHVPATYRLTTCSSSPTTPAAGGGAWPAQPRTLPVDLFGVGPSWDPTDMQNAPVSLSSASPEAQFATSASCADRTAALTVTLDANGNAPPTWVCFSDVGSTAGIALISTSGQLATSQTGAGTVTLTVDPEPAAIAVTAINPVAFVGSAQGLFNVSAFDVLANRLAISVQCQFQGTAEALLQGGIVPLQTAQPTAVGANLLTPGTLTLTVSPELAPSISCPSPSIMVQPDSDGGL